MSPRRVHKKIKYPKMNEWINKLWHVHTILNNENKWIGVTHITMDATHKYKVERKKKQLVKECIQNDANYI